MYTYIHTFQLFIEILEDKHPDAILDSAQKFYKSCLNSGKFIIFVCTQILYPKSLHFVTIFIHL